MPSRAVLSRLDSANIHVEGKTCLHHAVIMPPPPFKKNVQHLAYNTLSTLFLSSMAEEKCSDLLVSLPAGYS
jgi:hypothetical protein